MTSYSGTGAQLANPYYYSHNDASGNHGILQTLTDTREILEQLIAWTKYSKSDIAAMIGISRTSLYSYLDGENAAAGIRHKIIHAHLLAIKFVVEGGNPASDFMNTPLPEGNTLAATLSEEQRLELLPTEIEHIKRLVERSRRVEKTRDRIRDKFGQS